MTVKELIEILQTYPTELEVRYVDSFMSEESPTVVSRRIYDISKSKRKDTEFVLLD